MLGASLRRGRLAAVARRCLGLTLLGFALPAAAHLRFPKLAAEREIQVDLSGPSIQLHYRVGLGATLADQARASADRDGDRKVSALESNAAMDARTASLLRRVSVCAGPSLSDVRCRPLERRELARLESEGWVPDPTRHLHVTWVFDLRLDPHEYGAFRVEDDYQEPPGVEITDVKIKPPNFAALTEAGDAERPGGVTREFTWIERSRPPGPRRIVAAWPASRSAVASGWPVALAALLLSGLGYLALRRRAGAAGSSER